MPSEKTKFNQRWLEEKDANGTQMKEWCILGNTEYSGRCVVCKTEIKCDNSGVKQLIQHSKGNQHKKLCKTILSSSQTKLVFKTVSVPAADPGTSREQIPSSSKSKEESKLVFSFPGEDVLTAEIIWAVKCANSNISFRASDGISDTFRAMFKCPIADGFSVGRTKLSYMLTDGLHPAFSKALLYDVNNSQSFYTIQYDETTQAQVKKQMDLLIRYWSPTHDEVWCRYYRSLFFSHADGKTVARSMYAALKEDGFPLEMLIALGSDGPNVNKTINRELSSLIKDTHPGWQGFLDIDTCNLHTMHNAFCKGIHEYGQDVEDFALSLFGLFKVSAGRREDFKQIQVNMNLNEELFIKHSQVRWLSIGPALQRIIDQWQAICAYVAQLEKDPKTVPKSVNFKLIRDAIHKPDMKFKILFLLSVIPLFEEFLREFQSEQPLIHILYTRMSSFLITFMKRFLKEDVVEDGKENLTSIDFGIGFQLKDDVIELGEARDQSKKMSSTGVHMEILGVRSFYCTVTKYLIKRLPLQNAVLKSITCMTPSKRFADTSLTEVETLARQFGYPEKTIVNIKDEWKMYMTDDDLGFEAPARIDHFWREVMNSKHSDGKRKYRVLPELAKKALVLPHGNADVERSLSVNTNVVTVDRPAIGEKTINAIRMVKDIVKFSDPVNECPQSVPINNEVFSYVKAAHRNYLERIQKEKEEKEHQKKERIREHLENKKQQEQRKEQQERTMSMLDKEKNLSKEEDIIRGKLLSSELLLSEGNSKLKKALEDEDMQCASVAQMMISTASSKIEKLRKEMDSLRTRQKEVEKGKRKMLEETIESKKQKLMTNASTSKAAQEPSSSSVKHKGKGKKSSSGMKK